MKTAPPVKKIWGLCAMWSVAPKSFKGDTATMEKMSMFPSLFTIRKEDTQIFDTSHKIAMTALPDKVVRKQKLIGYDEDGNKEFEKTTWI